MERLKIHINQSVLENLIKRNQCIQKYIREEQKRLETSGIRENQSIESGIKRKKKDKSAKHD
jgi:hypothetical protein